MAEPSTLPGAPGEGEISPTPFTRQALEATLADAVRDAEIAAALAAEMGGAEDSTDAEAGGATAEAPETPETPEASETPAASAASETPAASDASEASDGSPTVTPPFSPPTQAAPRAARPPRETASGAAPGPRRGLLPSGIIPAQVRPDPAPTETRTPPRPRLIGSGLAGVGGPLGSGSGLHPSVGSVGSVGSDLDGGPSLAPFSPTPISLAPLSRGLNPEPADVNASAAEAPPVAFRRPKRPVQAPNHPASGTDGTDAANREASPTTVTTVPPRPSTPNVAWSPSDDDILPRGSARRRGWRRR